MKKKWQEQTTIWKDIQLTYVCFGGDLVLSLGFTLLWKWRPRRAPSTKRNNFVVFSRVAKTPRNLLQYMNATWKARKNIYATWKELNAKWTEINAKWKEMSKGKAPSACNVTFSVIKLRPLGRVPAWPMTNDWIPKLHDTGSKLFASTSSDKAIQKKYFRHLWTYCLQRSPPTRW